MQRRKSLVRKSGQLLATGRGVCCHRCFSRLTTVDTGENMRTNSHSAAFRRFAVASVLAAALAAVPMTAQAATTPAQTPGFADIVAPGDYFVGPDGQPVPIGLLGGPSDPDVMTPFLIDPVDHVQCKVRNNADHAIVKFSAKKVSGFAGGEITLKCGTATSSGYKHIQSGKQADWQARSNQEGLGRAWDDMMAGVVSLTLSNPRTSTIQTGNKVCYSANFILRDKNGILKAQYDSRVIVSANNKIIITAIPGGGCR